MSVTPNFIENPQSVSGPTGLPDIPQPAGLPDIPQPTGLPDIPQPVASPTTQTFTVPQRTSQEGLTESAQQVALPNLSGPAPTQPMPTIPKFNMPQQPQFTLPQPQFTLPQPQFSAPSFGQPQQQQLVADPDVNNSVRIDKYTTKSFVIFGEGTKDTEIQNQIKTNFDAKWNSKLENGLQGWIVSSTKAKAVPANAGQEDYAGLIEWINYFNGKLMGQGAFYSYTPAWLKARKPLKQGTSSKGSKDNAPAPLPAMLAHPAPMPGMPGMTQPTIQFAPKPFNGPVHVGSLPQQQSLAGYYDTGSVQFTTPDGRRFKLVTVLVEVPAQEDTQ